FAFDMLRIGDQLLRVGRQRPRNGKGSGLPLLLFNGIGGNVELLGPFARRLHEREVIVFDIPGVGHSQMPSRPYRMSHIVELACGVRDHYGHQQADVLGISWGGAAAQQFARSAAKRCRRLVLCATATGAVMVPSKPSVALKMVTPRRYMSHDYSR